MDNAGNLYGSTVAGGAHGLGTVFKLTPNGTETILGSLNNKSGKNPEAGVIADPSGYLYGTAEFGGEQGCKHRGCGTVFTVKE